MLGGQFRPDFTVRLYQFLLCNVCLGASFYQRQRRVRRSVSAQNTDGAICSPSPLTPSQCPARSPSVWPSSASSPPESSPCIITSYHLSWNSTSSRNTCRALKLANPPLSLNAPFVPFIISIQRECHTLPNEKKKKGAAVNAMAQHTHPFLIAFWFQGEIIIAHCHAIVTGRLELHFFFFKSSLQADIWLTFLWSSEPMGVYRHPYYCPCLCSK